MRKFNKNSLVFGFAIVFIIAGFCGNTIPKLSDFYESKYAQTGTDRIKGRLVSVWNASHENYDDKLFYFGSLMDVNSIKENLLGTRVIQKDNSTIVKTKSGKLHKVDDIRVCEEDYEWSTEQIDKLKKASDKTNAKFLYCAMPSKVYHETLPENITDYTKENYDGFLTALDKKGIPYVDLFPKIVNSGIKESEIYYNSDHHWKVLSAFTANKILCEELSDRYGFNYNKQYCDISNFSVSSYPAYFLGSWGKKVGTFFSWLGADDFDVIVPDFKTSFVEEQPFKNEIRNGEFEDTVLYKSYLSDNYYEGNCYDMYSGGTFRLQIFKNESAQNGKKILMVRDSFGQTVSAFLSLQVSEIHMCDVRNHTQFVGEKINIEEYINKIKPDYVIVCYTGAYSKGKSVGYYDFF